MTFAEEVYSLCRKVPAGKVTTYKEISLALGIKSYRAVGRALNQNHSALVPCHRVICSNGKIGGFNRGRENKIKLLRSEGVQVAGGKVELKEYLFELLQSRAILREFHCFVITGKVQTSL